MNRRTFVTGFGATLALSLAGCLGGAPTNGGDPLPDGGDGSGGAAGGGTHPRFTETSLTATGQCNDPGSATIAFDDDGVTVTGCARGRNGCAIPVLGEVAYSVEEDLLTVPVVEEVDRDEDEMCTEALIAMGYEARVEMDGMVPGNVRVVHDDVDGRREVARRSRDA